MSASDANRHSLSTIVAKHYNDLEEKGVNARKESRIYYMRNFNNWIKSVIIAQTLERIRQKRGNDCGITVLDMGCGKGGDLLKYRKGSIRHMVCADIADTSVKQCQQRYNDMKSNRNSSSDLFSAQFITADCTRENLKNKYSNARIEFDLVSIQFSFHYCFESLTQAQCMIRNACESLKVGGFLIGTTPDSQEIMKRLLTSGSNSFGNKVYSITFDEDFALENKKIPLFGAKYNFHLEGVVDCPEFLVYFPVFEDLCEKHGLKLLFRKSFAEYYFDNKDNRDNEKLLNIMEALECYPPLNDKSLVGEEEDDYTHVKNFFKDLPESNNIKKVGTLSKAEWDAISLYCVFAFEKIK